MSIFFNLFNFYCGRRYLVEDYNTLKKTRRELLKKLGVVLTSIPALSLLGVSQSLKAGDLPHVSEDDATAKSLKYVHDATKASERSNAEAICKNCTLYSGSIDSEWGPCSIFPSKVVNASGWCTAWVKKAG